MVSLSAGCGSTRPAIFSLHQQLSVTTKTCGLTPNFQKKKSKQKSILFFSCAFLEKKKIPIFLRSNPGVTPDTMAARWNTLMSKWDYHGSFRPEDFVSQTHLKFFFLSSLTELADNIKHRSNPDILVGDWESVRDTNLWYNNTVQQSLQSSLWSLDLSIYLIQSVTVTELVKKKKKFPALHI